MRSFYLILCCFCCASLPVSGQAGIYAFTDARGGMHFTNKPADPRYAAMKRIAYAPEPAVYPMAPSVNPERYRPLVEKAAREHKVDQFLLRAIISVESGYDAHAVSRKGAVGLMQVMPETAHRYGITDVYDPAQNIQAGARYLRYLLKKFNNDLSLTLAAYNAGEDAIQRYGNRIPPYRETLDYVPKVITLYHRYRANMH